MQNVCCQSSVLEHRFSWSLLNVLNGSLLSLISLSE
uniref:Uncharacterized protein n=1 Tax=Anguilla anguilla TaxID=7936 RepID=A0A0E9VKA5_ANGAN